ncbi:MAG: type II toxin-antitoxin system VapC family toxin [Saprospiraceae bacterium]
MKFLLDTHAFLWFNQGDPKLSSKARDLIENPQNEMLVSMASLWEIAIKNSLGKMELDNGFEAVMDYVTKNKFELLYITYEHTRQQNQLPFIHKDPFDRMFVSQALVEEIDVISNDEVMDGYFEGGG